MAQRPRDPRSRRYRSSPLDDIQGTLGTLLRTTLQQVGVVKDAVERQARSSLGHLDQVMLQRKRRDAFARLGEAIYALAADGRLGDLAELPEVAEIVAEIAELAELQGEGDLGAHPGEAEDIRPEAVSSASWRPPADRRTPAQGSGQTPGQIKDSARVWRPVMPADEPAAQPPPAAATSAQAREPQSHALHGRGAQQSNTGARAESHVQNGAQSDAQDDDSRADATFRARRRRSRQGDARGGIAFVVDPSASEEEDLREYMHEDDVPGRD